MHDRKQLSRIHKLKGKSRIYKVLKGIQILINTAEKTLKTMYIQMRLRCKSQKSQADAQVT